MSFKLSQRSLGKLDGVHPKLQEVVGSILNANGSPEIIGFFKNLETKEPSELTQ